MQSSYLNKIDMFGKDFTFNFNNERKYTSRSGGIMTILTLLTILLLIFYIGDDLVFHQNPTLITREFTEINRTNFTLNFSFAFAIEDNCQNTLDPDYSQYFSFSADLVVLGNLNGSTIETPTPISMANCDNNTFASDFDTQNVFNTQSLNESQCVANFSQYMIGGFFTDYYGSYINVKLSQCNASINPNCANTSALNDYIFSNQVQNTLYYEHATFNAIEYASPLTSFIANDYHIVDPAFCKMFDYYIKAHIVTTDDGWITVKQHNNTRQTFDYSTYQFTQNTGISSDCLINYRFFASTTTHIDYRSYIKIQEVLAQITGILNIVIHLLGFIFYKIYDRMMVEELFNCIFLVKKTDKIIQEDAILHGVKPELIKFDDDSAKGEIMSPDSSKAIKYNPKTNDYSVDVPSAKVSVLDRSTFKSIKERKSRMQLDDKEIEGLYSEENNAKLKSAFYLYKSEHFLLMFCRCCLSEKKKNKGLLFDKLTELTKEYTDILTIAKSKKDIEKIVFVLFNKKQLALYNMVPLPENPYKQKMMNNISVAYQFNRDKEAQKKKIKKFFSKNQTHRRSLLDEKILKYVENNIQE